MLVSEEKRKYHVVAGVVYRNARILCVKKGRTKYDYTSFKYEFPGGKIEQGETPQAALVRELKEELHIDVEVEQYLMRIDYEYPDFFISLELYFCSLTNAHCILEEHTDLQWLLPEQLPELPWCAADWIVCRQLVSASLQK